jgi:hypothetical protein
VGERTWAADWERRRAGDGCVMCAEGRPEVDAVGNVRYFAGSCTDAYLQCEAPTLGYSTVRWRGRHLADINEMTGDELAAFWAEVASRG